MRSAFQILKDSFAKIIATPKTFLLIIAVPAVIAVIASFVEPGVDFEGKYIWNSSAHVYQYSAIMLVFVIASMFMTIAVTLASNNTELGVREAYNMAFKKALPYIVLMIVSALVLIVAFILFIIPGIWLSVSFMFASYFLVLRNASAVESLKMSYALVKGRWWTVFFKSLMFGLLYILIVIPVFILLWVLGSYVGEDVSHAVESMIGVFGSLVTIVFMYEFFLDLERTQGTERQLSPVVSEIPTTPISTV